ncbi:glycoside hydrolase family 3 protein, partial [Streptomyces sp. NPDC054956]
MSTIPPPQGDGHPYRDPARPVDERVADLLARMTLEEKAGLMFHTIAAMEDEEYAPAAPGAPSISADLADMIQRGSLNHFNLVDTAEPYEMARWHNAVQEMAAGTRLGIPVTLSTDPRHSFSDHVGASLHAGPFSAWPEALGLAAVRDPELVLEFADIVRREYLAVGFRVALHPQIDL